MDDQNNKLVPTVPSVQELWHKIFLCQLSVHKQSAQEEPSFSQEIMTELQIYNQEDTFVINPDMKRALICLSTQM